MKIKAAILSVALLLQWHFSMAQIDTVFRSFTVSQTSDGVLINFTIRGGITCQGVKIERSSDRIHYNEIYEFAGVCGALNTDETYKFTDRNPVINDTAWYRLDLGSLGIYSADRALKYIDYNESGVVVFPNPCTGNCSVYFNNSSNSLHEIEIYSPDGALIYKTETYGSFFRLPDGLSTTGILFYRISRNEIVRFSGKLLRLP